MAVYALTGFSLVSLLSFGYLSWDWMKPSLVADVAMDPMEKSLPPAFARPPHIIFILTDDQGYHDVGYHGSDIQTPTLDRLAAEGVKLENYYIQPICTPSRSQLITGRYQIHTGLQHSIIRPRQPNCLPLDQVTLPQKLQEAGYSTHMVGKWHLGFYKKECLPTRRGFDTFLGSLTGNVDYYTYDNCDGPGVCGYDLHEGEDVAWDQSGKYSTFLYAQRVSKILASHSPKEPIFIYVAFQAVHTPLQSPKEYIYRYRSMGNVARRKYAAMVTCMDEAVKNITWALKNPLIKRKRRTSWALVHITDWYPTLVSLARGNLSNVPGLDGYNVWPAISEGKESPRTEILHNIDPLYNHAKYGSLEDGFGIWNTAVQASIRVGEWKLLTGDPGKSVWLFNITADPYERYDLSDQRPDVVRTLLMSEDDAEEWEGGGEPLKSRNKKKKCKICKLRSFFRKLNTRLMSNRI
ncbi:arylsulfatase I [Patagioenas fasciata monilis]|uniref:Arylsulfatase I n=1 Tax=Patagioenas fasciata monilis TaxID=372326 RepID=A0A1V4KUG7_PATFA|nr:arylsulfatase I [Patagioenas fasciata monilis]